MRILLINPGQLPDAGDDQFAARIDSLLFRAKPFSSTYFGIPLALPTLAGVTPAKHQVRIVDEEVQRIDFDYPCDLVGLSAMTCKATRAYQIAAEWKKRGVPVVMGGIHASMCPDEAARHVDSVVVGEADLLWTKILDDFERGAFESRYVTDGYPELEGLPPPRHDLTAHDRYFSFLLQTSRGCPRSCRFCTVTKFNGRLHRKKAPAQVVAEVEAITDLPNALRPTVLDRERGNRKSRVASGTILFVDDNFGFDRDHALSVCRALTAFRDSKGIHLNWITQCDLKTGFDDELLGAMKDAGCINIFMGFESLSSEALRALRKVVNTPERYRACIENIERHGIEVTASVIVGSDQETPEAGKEMAAFARESRIFNLFPNILTPYPGTVLAEEMESEGRVLRREPELYNIRNVVFSPKQMTPLQLQQLFVELCEDTLGTEHLLQLAIEKLKQPKRYYLTLPWRLFIWFAFSLMFITLFARRTIHGRELLAVLRHAPRIILRNGSLVALGFVASAVSYGTFTRSERRRLDRLERQRDRTPGLTP